jgi:hypothetical protein
LKLLGTVVAHASFMHALKCFAIIAVLTSAGCAASVEPNAPATGGDDGKGDQPFDDQATLDCGLGDLPLPTDTSAAVVSIVYMVPSDQPIDWAQRDFWHCASRYVQGWYRQQLGVTFAWSFREISIPQTTAELGCNSDSQSAACIDAALAATKAAGFPVYTDNTLYVAILQGDTGTYVGGRIDSVQGGGWALIGADLARDLVARNCSPGKCQTRWQGINHPGDFVTGGLAHEIGHAFGLPHPVPTEPDQEKSVMAEHWRFPVNQFLAREINTLLSNPLFTAR